jgi:hypothetical protein
MRETYSEIIINERNNQIDLTVYTHPAIKDIVIMDISSQDHQYEMMITHCEARTLRRLLNQYLDDLDE